MSRAIFLEFRGEGSGWVGLNKKAGIAPSRGPPSAKEKGRLPCKDHLHGQKKRKCVLSTRLLSPYRPFSRPVWFGVAQLHKSVRYPDESHWSEQPDWDDNPADYQSDLVLITSVT